jgi:hypothetical protein
MKVEGASGDSANAIESVGLRVCLMVGDDFPTSGSWVMM